MNCHRILLLCFLLFFAASTASAKQQDLPEIYAPGLKAITEESVKATISYLASDELGGRGTGTKEFQVAAEYVAGRFKKAGLKGGAKDGSFYHVKPLDLEQTPSEGLMFKNADGQVIENLGLLVAGEQAINTKGKIASVDPSKLDDLPEGLTVAVIDLAEQEGRKARDGGWIRASNAAVKLKQAGVAAMVLLVDKENPLRGRAETMRSSPRPPNPRIKMALPALLVDSEQAASLLNLQEVALACPAQALVKYEARNVVGYLPGTDPGLKDECIIFSAHLDHLGTVSNGQADPIYNGADDDASGVTAVLTLADAFSKTEQQPKRSILFVTFWGEESGLLGSRDFAASPPWDLNKVVANINIEMIGRPEPGANSKVWMTGWEKSDLGELMNEASKSVGVDIFDHPKYSSMLYRQSDNYSLAEKGVVAHSFSAGSLHSDYHQPSDEWEKLNLPHMTEVIKGLFIGSTPLVYSESRPQKAEK